MYSIYTCLKCNLVHFEIWKRILFIWKRYWDPKVTRLHFKLVCTIVLHCTLLTYILYLSEFHGHKNVNLRCQKCRKSHSDLYKWILKSGQVHNKLTQLYAGTFPRQFEFLFLTSTILVCSLSCSVPLFTFF